MTDEEDEVDDTEIILSEEKTPDVIKDHVLMDHEEFLDSSSSSNSEEEHLPNQDTSLIRQA